MKNIIKILSIITILAICGYFLDLSENKKSDGYLYFNSTRYQYSFKYPSKFGVGTGNDYGWYDLENQENIFVNKIFEIDFDRENNIENLSDYAVMVRNRQLNSDSENLKPKVGPLKRVIFAGKTAYSFTLTEGFNTRYGGYIIPSKFTYDYIITENSLGQKAVIYYLIENKEGNDSESIKISKNIRDSFIFY